MDHIIQLLQDYQAYQETGLGEDLGLFGEWLRQKYIDKENIQTDEEDVNEAGLDIMVSYMLGGMSAYMDYWVKQFYHDLPLVSMGDFGIIKSVEFRKNPTKKMIYEDQIMERTTCIESIKRLVKKGILNEETDPHDKRMKRVTLSEEGEKLNEMLNIKMMALGKLLVGNLNEVEKKSLMPALKKLNDFHAQLYRNSDVEKVKEMYGV